MTYEKVKFNVGDEQFDIIHCLGDGQCKCKSCEEKSWTSWFYKLSEEEDDVMCSNCLREILIQRRINEAVKKVLKDIGSIDDEDERFQYKDYQWFVDICKKYNVDRKELFPLKRNQKYDCTGCIWNLKTSKNECIKCPTCSTCSNSNNLDVCHCIEETLPCESICPYYETK